MVKAATIFWLCLVMMWYYIALSACAGLQHLTDRLNDWLYARCRVVYQRGMRALERCKNLCGQ